MYNSLVSVFIRKGHRVTVVTSNEGKSKSRVTLEGNAQVLRVRTLPLLNVRPMLKGLANILLSSQYGLAMNMYLRDRQYDLIVAPTPPITLTPLLKRLRRKNRAKVFLILRDVFPQNAVDLGMMRKNSYMHRYFRAMERDLYALADAIGCMTQGNIDYIRKMNPGVEPGKVHLLPNWMKPRTMVPGDGRHLLEKYGWSDKFIVVFGGNLGIAQKVDNIVEFGKIHRDKKDLMVLVIGRGTHKKYLQKLIKKHNIQNVKVLEYMCRHEYEQFVSLSKVGFVSLNEKFTIPNTPSRTLSYYNCRIPVFAIVDAATDYGKLLEEDNAGFWCLHGDFDAYKAIFDRLYYDAELRNRMGENGYNALTIKYTPETTYDRVASILSFV